MRKYNIGNINIRMSVQNKEFKKRLEEYRLDYKAVDATMKVKLKTNLKLPLGDIIAQDKNRTLIQGKGFTYLCVFKKDKEELDAIVRYDAGFQNVLVVLNKQLDAEELVKKEYILTGWAFQKIAVLQNKFILNASSVSHHGCGMLFCGTSEIGKSSQTALWLEYMDDVFVLSDEKPLLSFEDKIFVYGTPWSTRSKQHKNMRSPLKAIFFLKQANMPQLKELKEVEKVALQLKHMFQPYELEELDRLLEQFPRIINEVKLYDYEATLTKESVDLIHETLFSKRHLERCQTDAAEI